MKSVRGHIELTTNAPIVAASVRTAMAAIIREINGVKRAAIELNKIMGALGAAKLSVNVKRNQIEDAAKRVSTLKRDVNDSIIMNVGSFKAPVSKNGVIYPLNKRTIKGYARGTDNFPGGIGLVGEEGPELVELPQGTRISSKSETLSRANNAIYNSKKSDSTTINITVNVHLSDVVIRERADIDLLAENLVDKLQRAALRFA